METPRVRQLDYAANDESGQYVETLVIRSNTVRERYVLHRARIDGKGLLHQKVEFLNESDLKNAFPGSYRNDWKETDSRCGYHDLRVEEFDDARTIGFEARIKK